VTEREEIKRELIKTRGNALIALKEHPGWNDYLLPYIKEKIEANNSIATIKEENIERDFFKQKIKVDVYKGLIAIIDEWIKLGQKLEKQEDEDGK